MTRYNFAREGALRLGRVIEPGAIQWNENVELPVVWMFNFSSVNSVMGRASDIRRENDGWISAEIEWNSRYEALVEHDLNKNFFLSFYATGVDGNTLGGIQHVADCKLKCIGVVMSDPWKEVS